MLISINKHQSYRRLLRAVVTLTLIMLRLTAGAESPFVPRSATEEETAEFHVLFKVNSAKIDPSVYDNAKSINDAIRFLQNVKQDPTLEITEVSFCGTASPEGPYETNRRLANERLKALERFVKGLVTLPDDVVTNDCDYIPWNWLREQVEASDIADKEVVLNIIDQKPELIDYPGRRLIDRRVLLLQNLNGGRTWRELYKRFFKEMRMASAVLVTVRRVEIPEVEPLTAPLPETPAAEAETEVTAAEETVEVVVEEAPQQSDSDDWYRKMYIKTNAPAWAMLWQNVAVEFDIAEHVSFALPVYWSPYNYGTQTLKFRTLTFMPELRWWARPDNMGFFLNAHFGLAYYNFATKGEHRYQDHDGTTPAVGGGIGLGYRFYFCRNRHWTMEVALGGGVYHLDYDIFLNKHNINSGYLIGRRKRTFYCLDQAALTFSYSFGLRKKGGAK